MTFVSVSMGVFGFFTEMFIERSSTFHYTFVPFAEFSLVARATKRVNFRKRLQNLLRNHKVDEADTLHTCL